MNQIISVDITFAPNETLCVKGDAGTRRPANCSPPPYRRRFCVREEHFMFRTQQAVFSAARNVVCIRKQLARKGNGNVSEVAVSYKG